LSIILAGSASKIIDLTQLVFFCENLCHLHLVIVSF